MRLQNWSFTAQRYFKIWHWIWLVYSRWFTSLKDSAGIWVSSWIIWVDFVCTPSTSASYDTILLAAKACCHVEEWGIEVLNIGLRCRSGVVFTKYVVVKVVVPRHSLLTVGIFHVSCAWWISYPSLFITLSGPPTTLHNREYQGAGIPFTCQRSAVLTSS